MTKHMQFSHRLALSAATGLILCSHAIGQSPRSTRWFHPLASYGVPNGGVAEIVDATADGQTLIYSDSGKGTIGLVDIRDPEHPKTLSNIPTAGEPTSVSAHGNIAVAAIWLDKHEAGQPPPSFGPSSLLVLDLSNPRRPKRLGTVAIGPHPDAVKLTRIAGKLVAVVCIENEPVIVEGGKVQDDDAPGNPNDVSSPGYVQVIVLDLNKPSASKVSTVQFGARAMTTAGMLFPRDPQPEFVDVHGDQAAVTLQENNGLALIDLSDPRAPKLRKLASTGIAKSRDSDMTEDNTLSLTERYPDSATGDRQPRDGGGNPQPAGARMPDALTFSPDGRWIYTADEGELDFTGGRGISAFDAVSGELRWTDGGQIEQAALLLGQYPEGRAENKGIEMEGCTAARFSGRDYGCFMSERGSFLAIYTLDGKRPRLHQILPTGISPEGVVAIPARGLLVTADEESGTLTFFAARRCRYRPSTSQPTLFSRSLRRPFAALSGLGQSGLPGLLLSVPDNALPTTIYGIRTGSHHAPVYTLARVTRHGKQARYDGEGIQRDTSILGHRWFGGYWIASEGNGTSQPNLLVQVNLAGRVLREIQLPFAIDPAADPKLSGRAQPAAGGQKIRGNGFEGLAISPDGRYLYAAIQREFAGEFPTTKYSRIARYDLRQLQRPAPGIRNGLRHGGDWDFYFYRLDSDNSDNWAGLSDLVNVGPSQFLVIERDKGTGLGSELKKIYAFSLQGLRPDRNGKPDVSDTVRKISYRDILPDFAPYEKVEGLTLDAWGRVWVGLDNDGGEVENRLRRYGRFRSPLK